MKANLRSFASNDDQLLEEWVNQGEVAEFMSRWSPRPVAYENSGDLVRRHVIVVNRCDVGTIWMERDSPTLHFCDMGILIAKPHRGLGIGAEAILLAEKDAVAAWGIKLVRLRVRESNERAINCYKRVGFLPVGKTRKMIGGAEIGVLIMEHRLVG